MLDRRRFVSGLTASGILVSAHGSTLAMVEGTRRESIYFVAGYSIGSAYRYGQPVVEDPELSRALPPGHDGSITMITRVEPAADREVRALYPLRGHQIVVSPDRKSVVFVGMNDPRLALVDFTTLRLWRMGKPHDESFVFGGHACFSSDGSALFVAERRMGTLSFLVLNPIPRWKIVLPKLLASVAVSGLLSGL